MSIGGLLILFYKPYPFRESTTEYQYYLDSLNTLFFTIGISLLIYYFTEVIIGTVDEDIGLSYLLGIVPIILVLGIHTRSSRRTMATYIVSSALMVVISIYTIHDIRGQGDMVLFWILMAIFNVLMFCISFT